LPDNTKLIFLLSFWACFFDSKTLMNLFSFSASVVSVFARSQALGLCLPLVVAVPTALAQTPETTPTSQAAPVSTPPVAPAAPIFARGPAGSAVSATDVLSELQRAPEASRQAILARPESLQQIANNLLVRRVLADEAQRDGLDKDPAVAASLAVARDRVLSDARLVRLDAQNAPSEAALDAYARNVYKVNSAKYEKPAQTRARHILLPNNGPDSLKKAKDLLAELRAGASFEELAKANSTDTGSAARGGDLGFFGAGQMVRPFEDAVNALSKPGDLSEPVESQFGYHIIRLEERQEKRRQTYEEVRSQLLTEARVAILNDSRVQKVASMNKDFVFDKSAIEALSQSAAK
jgi:peptidyl-prolyl cis-trans isomerase C